MFFSGAQAIRPRFSIALALVAAAASLCVAASPASPASSAQTKPKFDRARIARNYGKLPLSFEANTGQSAPDVKFLSRGSGYSLFLTDNAAVLSLTKGADPRSTKSGPTQKPFQKAESAQTPKQKTDVIRMELTGANKDAHATGTDQLPGTANYFLGNDPAQWHTGAPTYAKVRYAGVYPGVDLVYYGNQRQLEYDFVVAPNADPKPIRLTFAGAKKVKLDPDGNLLIMAPDGQIAFHKPEIYQQTNGQRTPVKGQFALSSDHSVSFTLGNYDHTKPLVIDPVLAYSTYLGGGEAVGAAIAVDSFGNAFVTGSSVYLGYPLTPGAFQTTDSSNGYSIAVITRLNSSGTGLIYSTYLGGTTNNIGQAIAVDGDENAFVAGYTNSSDFPVTKGAFQVESKAAGVGGQLLDTGFITKLNATGTALLYSTYLGGDGGGNIGDFVQGIAIDKSGNAFVTGVTSSDNFPVTQGAYQTTNYTANWTSFVTKLNQTGSALLYSTFLGGSNSDVGNAIAVDSSGNAYIAGGTSSVDFPVTAGAFQTTYNAISAFVTKLNESGSALEYSTFLGGSVNPGGTVEDQAFAVALNTANEAYVVGYGQATDFPVTKGAFQTKKNTVESIGFVTRLNSAGTALIYSTFLGGSMNDLATGLAVDASGNAYITGTATSRDFPVTKDAFQPSPKNPSGVATSFVTSLNPSGSALLYSTYLGGSNSDAATGIALDSSANIYVVGTSNSSDFPVTAGAFETTNPASDAFITKFGTASSITDTTTTVASDANPQSYGGSVTFTAGVVPSSGTGTPTGYISFSVDGGAANSVALSSGKATYTTSSLTAGSHTILASYGGSISYAASSASLSETISSPIAASPIFSPAVGTYTTTQTVTIKDATSGAAIYYTTNGTTPTTSSTKYTSAINVSATETIEAIAVATGYTNSAVASATYAITQAIVSIAPSTLTFPTTITGAISTAQTLTITNTGTAALTVHSYALTGTAATSFELGPKTCGTSLAAGASCTLSIAFKPTAAGTLTASLVATDSATNSPQTVALSGTGQLPPTITLTPNEFAFPDTTVGATSASQVVTVKNIGATTVTVRSYTFTGAGAASYEIVTKTCGTSLAAGASCTITLAFKPTDVGSLPAEFNATDSSPGSPQTAALIGIGGAQPTISLSPSSLTFAATKVGAISKAQEITVTNTGSTTYIAHSYAFTGTNATSFLISSKTCGTLLASGASCTISIAFKPTATGALTGNLAATDNAVGSPQTVPLSGTGN